MNVTTLAVSKKQAEQMYREYRDAQKAHDDAYIKDIKILAGHMRHGRVVLDVWQAMREAGLNERFDPRLAICRADSRQVFFVKHGDGSSRFTGERAKGWNGVYLDEPNFHGNGPHGEYKDDVTVPTGLWSAWALDTRRNIVRRILRTVVPVIPSRFLPADKLANYHLLWEPEEWTDATPKNPPRDPMLLKRVSPNMFVVMAAWELTDLERAVLRGRIA